MKRQTDVWYEGDPSWSPDGKIIAVSRGIAKDGIHAELFALDAETGKETRMSDKLWAVIDSIQWDSSRSGVLMRAGEKTELHDQIYYMSYPSGKVTSITHDANNYIAASATTDFQKMCVVQREPNYQLYVVPNGDSKQAKKISDQQDDGFFGIAISKNGEIYYTSSRGETIEIHAMDQEGNKQRQLASTVYTNGISLSPDGSHVLFSSSSETELPGIWRVNVDGSGLKKLSSGNDQMPVMDPLGRWIYLQTWKSGVALTIMKIPAEGGSHVDVSGMSAFWPMPSPDGKTVYFAHIDDQQITMSLWSAPSDGGKAVHIFDFPSGYDGFFRLRPNSREVSYIVRNGGVANIWIQSIDGGPPKMYTNFSEDNIADHEWMPDGKSLVVSHGHSTADVVLITQEK
jgi:Tol biopolymer transport system component